ncbi:MAG: RNA methyltransferase [Mycoplasmataceae bacterium]|jgi:TrmH family RNA methyltransferase|nr:RNA methyltransferase [Mycoplasmataceae bacterium]
MLKIASSQNKLIKSVKKLLIDSKYRHTSNLFVAETYRVIKQLIDNKQKCRNIIVRMDSKYLSQIKQLDKNGLNCVEVNNQIFNTLSSLENSDGVIGVFNSKKNELVIENNKKYILLDRIQNPINLGSIIRTSVALGINGIIITNNSVDITNQKVIKTSVGTCFNIPIKVITSLTDAINKLKTKGIRCYATSLNPNSTKLNDVVFQNGTCVIFGNEGTGLKEKDVKLCDETIYIPITNKVDSLNVNVACAIVMYQLCKN